MLNALIIEDEGSAQQLLSSILNEYCPTVNLLGVAGTMLDSVALINDLQPDLIFLDVELEDCTAFDLLNAVDYKKFKIIFTTAYEEHAIKAFRYEAIDYILKPYAPKDVIESIERVRVLDYDKLLLQKLNDIIPQNKPAKEKKISFSTSKGIILIDQKNILHVEAEGSYSKVFTTNDKSILVSKGIKEVEQQLSSIEFFRSHISHLINVNHIKEFRKEDGGFIVLSNDKLIPVARRKKSALVERLAIDFS